MPEQQSNEDKNEQEEVFTHEFTFTPGRHVWRQSGPYLICKECSLHHAVYIGMEKIMVGEDKDGKPILKDRRGM